nr:FCD domain-containing protein [Micromonospora sp. DSM 115978]
RVSDASRTDANTLTDTSRLTDSKPDLTEDAHNYRDTHAEFHSRLADGCPSPRLREIRARLFDAAQLYRYWQVPEQRGTAPVSDPHGAICEAALRRDADAAADLLAAHIQAAADRLLKAAAGP